MSGKSGDEARGDEAIEQGVVTLAIGRPKSLKHKSQVDLRQVETDVQSVGLKLKVVCVSKHAIEGAFLR